MAGAVASVRRAPLRLGAVQFTPEFGNVDANERKVYALTERLQEGCADLIVLPELALTGYKFDSLEEISPYLERVETSRSIALARTLAQRLRSYVVIGFPETNVSGAVTHDRSAFDARPEGSQTLCRCPPTDGAPHNYNSAALVSREGVLLHVFRKHFLYEDDKRWATEGPGFQTIDLPDLGRLCVAICMDLNPYDFQAPQSALELANFCSRGKVDILALSMAWQLPDEDVALVKDSPDEPSYRTSAYWVWRLGEDNGPARQDDHPLNVIIANRTGTEKGTTFAGSSCQFQMINSRIQGKTMIAGMSSESAFVMPPIARLSGV